MKIEMWSDFVCPYCYMAKRKLEMALDQFPLNNNVVLVYKSYELYPDNEKSSDTNIHTLTAEKYGISQEKARENNEMVCEQAKAAGLTYHLEEMQRANTFDAHRLAQYARKKGKASELIEALFRACFTESKNISDHGTLQEVASRVRLDDGDIATLLESRKYRNFVRDDEEQAKEIGVDRIPFFVFNEKFAVSGGQSVEMFMDILKNVQEKEGTEPHSVSPVQSGTIICTDESCEIKRD